jgi:hypothetical protein
MKEKPVNEDLFVIILHGMINHNGKKRKTFNFILKIFFFRYFELIEKHGNLKPLVDIKIRAPYLVNVRLIYNQITYEKEIDVRQTVQQFKKYLHDIFQIPLTRLRVFFVDDVAFNMGVGGPEELKYPQKLLHTYVFNEGKAFF